MINKPLEALLSVDLTFGRMVNIVSHLEDQIRQKPPKGKLAF